MKNTCIGLLLFLGCYLSSSAQSLDRFVIGAAGAYAESASMSLEYTAGEAAVATLESGTFVLNQGFHQSNPPYSTAIETPQIQVAYRIYPNPTPDQVFVELQAEKALDLELHVLDLRGRQTPILSQHFSQRQEIQTQFDLTALPAGIYLIQLQSLQGEVAQTFRVEKMN